MITVPDWVFEFHGHRCPAMPAGYRAGLAAMKKLGVERAHNKELFLICENGPAHAMGCFLDGVMAATGCTYGKANAEKKNFGKTAIILVDVKRGKAVRVVMNPEFQKKALSSEFVKLRKQGVEPKDVPPEVTDKLVNRVLSVPDEEMFKVGEVHDSRVKGPKGTFNWYECEHCGEIVFENATRLLDGKKVCIPCFEEKMAS
jgi:formylmethanofuran dehydrogenase subunit E